MGAGGALHQLSGWCALCAVRCGLRAAGCGLRAVGCGLSSCGRCEAPLSPAPSVMASHVTPLLPTHALHTASRARHWLMAACRSMQVQAAPFSLYVSHSAGLAPLMLPCSRCRHLCEFTGLDFEMAIHEHYFEVLDVIEKIFMDMFRGLEGQYARELEVVAQQYPFEPIAYKPLRLTFPEGIKMLQENGYPDVSSVPPAAGLPRCCCQVAVAGFLLCCCCAWRSLCAWQRACL